MCYLLTNVQFMCFVLALTGMYFVTTGIQFWITDYFQNVYGISKEAVFIFFGAAAVTGPVFGVVAGGYVFNHIGGYTDPRSLNLAIVVCSISSVLGFSACFFDRFLVVISLLWIQFFAGGFTMPVLLGILLNMVP